MSGLDLMATASRLRDCVCPVLEAQGWTGTCCVWPGADAAWDSCCENGGQFWVTVKSGYATSIFPAQDQLPSQCGRDQLAVFYELGVLRCVAGAEADCDRKEDDAARVMGDFQALLEGVTCCFDDDHADWVLAGFTFLGPSGGCAGSTLSIIVNEHYPCCEES